jgi:PAS domain S-box-containing protein
MADAGQALLELTDVREQLERANRTIEEQAHHLQMVMDSATIAIFSLSTEGKFMSANQMTAEMTGRPVADLIGTPFAKLVDGDDSAEALVAKVIEDGFFVSNREATVRRADSSLRTVILSMRALTRAAKSLRAARFRSTMTRRWSNASFAMYRRAARGWSFSRTSTARASSSCASRTATRTTARYASSPTTSWASNFSERLFQLEPGGSAPGGNTYGDTGDKGATLAFAMASA